MTNKNELNIEELEKVSGGAGAFESGYTYKIIRKIDQYEAEAYIGEYVACENKGDSCIDVVGTIVNSYDEYQGHGTVKRVVAVKLHPSYKTFNRFKKDADGNLKVYGDCYTFHLIKIFHD